MIVYVDMGNSRIKASYAGADKPFGVVDSSEAGVRELCAMLLANKASLFQIVISNVGDDALVHQLIDGVGTIPVELVRVLNGVAGFDVVYSDPAAFGVDRWLVMLGALSVGNDSFCVIDLGTAITVDVVIGRRHQGGFIGPGIRLMRHSLRNNTARLELDGYQGQSAWGTETSGAIHKGTLLAAVGFIQQSMDRFYSAAKAKGLDGAVILTGGDSGLVAADVSGPVIVDDQLIFKGMDFYLQQK